MQSACNTAALHLPDQRDSEPGSLRFQVLVLFASGIPHGGNAQHRPSLTVRTSFIPKAVGLCCTVLPVQSF